MRLGESDLGIAQTGRMGRKKAKAVRALVIAKGWLDLDCELPNDAELAASFYSPVSRPQAVSVVQPDADKVTL